MTASAQRQARAELRWWRANRDAKHVFSEELRAARRVLAHGPKLEIYGYFESLPVRRLLLEKTRCHVYYLVLEPEKLVRIVAIWGAARGVEPRLG
jgi:plasmid stabilization system protein ParE